MKLQYEEEVGPKKTRNVAMGDHIFTSRDNFTFRSRNMKLWYIAFFVTFAYYEISQRHDK